MRYERPTKIWQSLMWWVQRFCRLFGKSLVLKPKPKKLFDGSEKTNSSFRLGPYSTSLNHRVHCRSISQWHRCALCRVTPHGSQYLTNCSTSKWKPFFCRGSRCVRFFLIKQNIWHAIQSVDWFPSWYWHTGSTNVLPSWVLQVLGSYRHVSMFSPIPTVFKITIKAALAEAGPFGSLRTAAGRYRPRWA